MTPAVNRIDEIATEIRDRIGDTRKSIMEIGNRLIEAKKILAHGKFGDWLKCEFDWTERTAQRWMVMASNPKSDILSDLGIPPSAIAELSAPSTPAKVVERIIDEAKKGKPIGVKEVRQAKAEARAAITPNPDDIEPDEDDEPEPLPDPAAEHRHSHNSAIESALAHLQADSDLMSVAFGHEHRNGTHVLTNPESKRCTSWTATIGLLRDTAKALKVNLIVENPEKPGEYVSAASAEQITRRNRKAS